MPGTGPKAAVALRNQVTKSRSALSAFTSAVQRAGSAHVGETEKNLKEVLACPDPARSGC
jgi:hypothetical protein